jgi:hypothetical protein
MLLWSTKTNLILIAFAEYIAFVHDTFLSFQEVAKLEVMLMLVNSLEFDFRCPVKTTTVSTLHNLMFLSMSPCAA